MVKTTPSMNDPVDEDIAPRNTLPAEVVLPQEKPKPGWQVDPLPIDIPPFDCPHIGRTKAANEAMLYPIGAEWACTCGELFVVAYTKGGKLTLRKKTDVDETPEDPSTEN